MHRGKVNASAEVKSMGKKLYLNGVHRHYIEYLLAKITGYIVHLYICLNTIKRSFNNLRSTENHLNLRYTQIFKRIIQSNLMSAHTGSEDWV